VTLVAAGVLLLRASPLLKSGAAAGFFAIAGLVHGYAYGEAIVGAEPTPLAAYLAGYTVVQVAIVFAGFGLARVLDTRRPALGAARAFGGALSIVGAAFLVLSLA
jgi:urease accessory protein